MPLLANVRDGDADPDDEQDASDDVRELPEFFGLVVVHHDVPAAVEPHVQVRVGDDRGLLALARRGLGLRDDEVQDESL